MAKVPLDYATPSKSSFLNPRAIQIVIRLILWITFLFLPKVAAPLVPLVAVPGIILLLAFLTWATLSIESACFALAKTIPAPQVTLKRVVINMLPGLVLFAMSYPGARSEFANSQH
jgi:hypothetical protein